MSLLTKALAALLLILLIVSAGFNVYLAFETHSLNSQVTKLTADNKMANDNLKACKDGVAQSNIDVVAAQKAAKDKQDALDTLGKNLVIQQNKNKVLIDKMAAQPAPKTCDAAKEFLKQNVEIYKW